MARSAYTSSPRASTATFAREPADDTLEAGRIRLIERRPPLRIDVQDGDERSRTVEHGDDDLGLRARVARDVSGEAGHVGYHNGATFRGGGPADAPAERN